MNWERYETLIGSLYESVVTPDTMNHCMRDIAELFEARDSVLMIMNTGNGLIEQEFYWTAPEDYGKYEEYYYRLDPRIEGLEAQPIGEIWSCHEHFDAAFIRQDPFYNEYFIPAGVRYTMGGRLVQVRERMVYYALHRAPGQPHFGESDKLSLTRIYPHLARSARLFIEFQELRGGWTGATAETLMGLMDRALIVSDVHGHIHFANLAAESLLREGASFTVRNKTLFVASGGNDHAELVSALRDAASKSLGREFVVGRDTGCPLFLRVIPLPSDYSDPAYQKILLWLTPLRPKHEVNVDLLRRLFGLSLKEAKLTCALAEGLTLTQYADETNVAYGTVRSQVHAVFEKVGVSRQSELIALVAHLPASEGEG